MVGGKTEEREWIVGKQLEEKNDLLVDFIIKRNKDGTLNAVRNVNVLYKHVHKQGDIE